MKLTRATVATLMLIVGIAQAGQGEICYSSSMPATQANPLTNDTKFACPSLGQVSISEIYQLGWKVSYLSDHELVIDTNNPLNSQSAWIVLIEKL